MGYDPIATVQQAITVLLAVSEPQFLAIGNQLFASFATILIVWRGVRMMLSGRGLGEDMYGFAKLLLFIAFGYAMIAYYASPIYEHLFTFLTRLRLDVDVTCPECGTHVPIRPAAGE